MEIANFAGLRDSLFYIGVIVFSVTLFIEHFFKINLIIPGFFTGFFKGLGVSLELLGAVFLIIKRISH